jgi:hypothetical protein
VTVDDADVFMPADFLDGFAAEGAAELGGGLTVTTYLRK